MDRRAERRLALRAQAGDTAAFGQLVREHQKGVYNVAWRLLGRRQDAEDATQEAFVRAYKALARYDSERPLAPWLKRIAANVCLNWLAAERVRPHTLAAELAQAADGTTALDRVAAPRPTPEEALLTSEQATLLRAAILRLSPRQRAVIELRHFQGMTYAEIAEALQRPLSDIRSDLYRARKQLARHLPERIG